jgi:6-phosphogluconate dehydrogenase
MGIPIPTLAQSVNARIQSGLKDARVEASKILTGPDASFTGDVGKLTKQLHDALHLSMIVCYAQGLHLIQGASKQYDYGTDLAEVARIWKEGCIIRSKLLDPIKAAFKSCGLSS